MRLLNRSPFSNNPSDVFFKTERVRIRDNQIILWMTLTIKRITSPDPSATPFPVILDTGFSHSFSIREHHLVNWAGIQPEELALLGTIRDRNQKVLLRAANIWVHPNVSCSRDKLIEQVPHSLDGLGGIAIYPREFPRLPILGLRAIAENKLSLEIDGARREATVQRAIKWWWPFA
jgi:hypothetical protein